MRVEFMTEVPAGISSRVKVNRGKYSQHLKKVFEGEEKCVVFTFDSAKELRTAQQAIRYSLRRNKDKGEFHARQVGETNQLYVYKV